MEQRWVARQTHCAPDLRLSIDLLSSSWTSWSSCRAPELTGAGELGTCATTAAVNHFRHHAREEEAEGCGRCIGRSG